MKGAKTRNIGSISEFGLAIFVFFLIILFPVINLLGLAMGYGTLYLASKQCAVAAGTSPSYAEALVNASSTAQEVTSGGFGKFAKLQPIGGVNGSGLDLYIVDTDIASQTARTHGPNTPMAGTVDTDSCVYEYETVLTCDVGPFMNLSAFPFIGNVPGIGVPSRLTCTAHYHIEHTDDISGGAASGGNNGGVGGNSGGGGNPGGGGGNGGNNNNI